MLSPLLKLIPPWCVLALLVHWYNNPSTASLVVLGAATMVELLLWYSRLARAQSLKAMAQGRPPGGLERLLNLHPAVVVVGLMVFGVLIDLARMAFAVGAFGWWLVVAPAVLVNRQRYERAKAHRLAATAQAVLSAATCEAHVAAGASLQERALTTLAQPFGLRAAPRQIERRPAPPQQVAIEAAPVQVEQNDTPVFRTVNGITEMLVASKADGAVYEPLPSGDWLGDR